MRRQEAKMAVKKKIVAFSGGKDSTAVALIAAAEGEPFELLFTATGNELPEVHAHIEMIASLVNAPLIMPKGPKLLPLIEEFGALPNFRQRWCTRMIKIAPCIAYLKQHPGSTLLVGLRADEEERQGLYGDYATYRFPLRERGMRLGDVLAFLEQHGIAIPKRTDCAWCYGQRLTEWYALWRDNGPLYEEAAALERKLGHTFRSPGRDTWPASLDKLAEEFCRGRRPRGQDAYDQKEDPCRVCRM